MEFLWRTYNNGMQTRLENRKKLLKWAAVVLLLTLYLIYTALAIYTDRGPVDYETFMNIGGRLLAGGEVYGENSYYPMPYVMIFAAFAALPRAVSLVLWLLGPVVAALFISGGNPLVLLYAPVFGHFANLLLPQNMSLVSIAFLFSSPKLTLFSNAIPL